MKLQGKKKPQKNQNITKHLTKRKRWSRQFFVIVLWSIICIFILNQSIILIWSSILWRSHHITILIFSPEIYYMYWKKGTFFFRLLLNSTNKQTKALHLLYNDFSPIFLHHLKTKIICQSHYTCIYIFCFQSFSSNQGHL